MSSVWRMGKRIGQSMVEWARIGLVLLGAGQSTRFGSNKLAEPLLGIPLVRRTAVIFAGMPFARRVVVVQSGTPSVADLGFEEIVMDGAVPQSASLRAGIEHLSDTGLPLMVALADMPLVTRSHIEALGKAFTGCSGVCSISEGIRSPPAIFSEPILRSIVQQTGDVGARQFIKDLPAVEAAPSVLLDVDNRDDFAVAWGILSRSNLSDTRSDIIR